MNAQTGCVADEQQDLALSAVITGRVQGVGYRYFAQRTAVALGLVGYVRNLSDGSVELHASGDQNSLQQLVRELWKGPPSASVERVATEWTTPKRSLPSFRIRF